MTTQELIEKLQKMPADATVKVFVETEDSETFYDVNAVENLTRLRVTTAGIEHVETVTLDI